MIKKKYFYKEIWDTHLLMWKLKKVYFHSPSYRYIEKGVTQYKYTVTLKVNCNPEKQFEFLQDIGICVLNLKIP